jgi:hypothetical protein
MSQLIFLDSGIVGIVTNPKTARVSCLPWAPLFVGRWEKRDRLRRAAERVCVVLIIIKLSMIKPDILSEYWREIK